MDQRLIKWEREFSNKKEAEKRFLVELNGLYKNQNSNEAKNLGPAINGLRVWATKANNGPLVNLDSGLTQEYYEDDPNDTSAYTIKYTDLIEQIQKDMDLDKDIKERALNYLKACVIRGVDRTVLHNYQIVSIVD